MAQHGYLHDSYDNGDFGRDEDRDRDEHRRPTGWRDQDREWRGSERGMMFGDEAREGRWSSRDQDRGRDEDRGFFSRMADEAGSWFQDDESQRHDRGRRFRSERDQPSEMSRYGREHGIGGFQGDYGRGSKQGGFGGRGDWQSGRESYSSHPDDHYRSWRDKQVQQLDNDYRDYCREREQQFHQDFDSWRQNRQSQPSGQGQAQQSTASESASRDNPAAQGGEIADATTSPTGAATLGSNNSENTTGATGRGRR